MDSLNADGVAVSKRMVYSASRIGTWMGCHRAAGWRYFAGYITPPSAANNRGTAVHALLEEWRQDSSKIDYSVTVDDGGKQFPAGKVAGEIMLHWPPPAEGEQIEGQFSLQGRNAWMGYKDLEVPGMVVDYKTTSDLKYMKTAKDLLVDPQAILYAEDYFALHPSEETVALRWIYANTRPTYRAKPVDVVMTRAHASLGFAALESYADEMQAAADACPPASDPIAVHKYVLTLAKSEDQCDAYGGCPHKERCGIPMFRDKQEPKKVNVLDRMLAMNQNEAKMTTAPAPAQHLTVGGPADAPNNDALSIMMGLLEGPPAAVPGKTLNDVPAVVNNPGNAWKPPSPLEFAPSSETVTATAQVAAINPPKRPGRPPGSKNKPKDAPTADAVIADVSRAVDAVLATVPVQTTVAPAHVAEVSRELAALLATGPTLDPRDSDVPDPVPDARARLIDTLVVGATVQGTDFVDFDTLVQDAREAIGADAYFNGFGYKTNGNMFNMICKMLAAKPVETLVVKNPGAINPPEMLGFLRAHASVLVEAVR